LQEKKTERENEKREVQEQEIQERVREIEAKTELARRRRQVEKALAVIGTPGLQESVIGSTTPMNQNEELTQGPESIPVDNDPELAVKCFYDAPFHGSQSMKIFILPVIQGGTTHCRWAQVQGLLVRRVDYSPDTNYYQRIGMFEIERIQLQKSTHIPMEEEFCLI
jgi:hypothetical protein